MQLDGRTRTLMASLAIVALALLACKKKTPPTTESAGAAPPPTVAPKPAPVPLPETPTKTFGLKEAAVLDGVTVTVEEFKDCPLDNFYSRRALAKKKEKLVGANVLMEGSAEKDHTISYTNFKVTDPEGMTFRSTVRSGSKCSPPLSSGRVGKGEKTRGWVMFEVPEKASGFKIVYTNRRPYRTGTPAGEQEQKASFSPGG